MTATPEQLTFREAATSARELHPISHPRHEMWEQLARLWEGCAARPELAAQALYILALTAARAYLAAVDRPDIDGRAT